LAKTRRFSSVVGVGEARVRVGKANVRKVVNFMMKKMAG